MNIRINALYKSYKKKHVLENLSFNAKSGDIIGIAGSNGSGKSTLLSVLAGTSRSDSGSFYLNETDLFKNPKLLSSSVGYVPQNTVLFEELSGTDNLRLWYSKYELETALQSDGILSILELEPFMSMRVSKMSGGMKKRLSIACAAAHAPKILLLDEPSGTLDLPCKQKLYSWYKSFTAQGGIIILATHDIQEIKLCTKIFVLKDKSLVPYDFTGDAQNLISFLEQDGV